MQTDRDHVSGAHGVENQARRRRRAGEPLVRQLLRPILHGAHGLEADVQRGTRLLRGRARERPRVGRRADGAGRRREQRSRSQPLAGVRAQRDRHRKDGRLRDLHDVRVTGELCLRRGCVREDLLGVREDGRAGGQLFPADRGSEHLERHVPRDGELRVHRRRLRAGRRRRRLRIHDADELQEHDRRRPPRFGQSSLGLVRPGLRRGADGGKGREVSHGPDVPCGRRHLQLSLYLRPGRRSVPLLQAVRRQPEVHLRLHGARVRSGVERAPGRVVREGRRLSGPSTRGWATR